MSITPIRINTKEMRVVKANSLTTIDSIILWNILLMIYYHSVYFKLIYYHCVYFERIYYDFVYFQRIYNEQNIF